MLYSLSIIMACKGDFKPFYKNNPTRSASVRLCPRLTTLICQALCELLIRCLIDCTNKTELGELQDHPVFGRELQSKVLHCGKVVGLGHNVVLQLNKHRNRKCKM